MQPLVQKNYKHDKERAGISATNSKDQFLKHNAITEFGKYNGTLSKYLLRNLLF